MKKPIIAGMLFFFLIQVFFLNIAHAQTDPVDISELPQRFADALNIPLFAGQLLTTALTLAVFLFPSMLLAKGRASQTYVILFVGITVMSMCVALGWLPYFILLIVCLLIATMYAGKMRGWIGG